MNGAPTQVIGLTSRASVAWVRSLGVYTDVVEYGSLATVPDVLRGTSAALVDVAGNAEMRATLFKIVGASVVTAVLVGMSHTTPGERESSAVEVPADVKKRTQVFFAPAWIKGRPHGAATYAKRISAGWSDLLEVADRWITSHVPRGLWRGGSGKNLHGVRRGPCGPSNWKHCVVPCSTTANKQTLMISDLSHHHKKLFF